MAVFSQIGSIIINISHILRNSPYFRQILLANRTSHYGAILRLFQTHVRTLTSDISQRFFLFSQKTNCSCPNVHLYALVIVQEIIRGQFLCTASEWQRKKPSIIDAHKYWLHGTFDRFQSKVFGPIFLVMFPAIFVYNMYRDTNSPYWQLFDNIHVCVCVCF